MNAEELRAAAERLIRNHRRYSPRASSDALLLASHVLATVREDDGEAVTEEWLQENLIRFRVKGLCGETFDCRVTGNHHGISFLEQCQTYDDDFDKPDDMSGKPDCVLLGKITRGQLRRLCEALEGK